MPYRPRLEFAIGLFGLAVCALGIGLVTADVLEKTPAEVRPHEPTTTTTMINSSVIVPETTTTTTSTPAKNPPLSRVHLQKARVSVPTTAVVQQLTTTTTEAPKTPLEVALSQLGKTGPYADGGFWCAKFTSWTAEQAKVPGFISRDGPSALYADSVADGRLTQTPAVGDMIFIDLFGPDGIGHGQVTHVGIVESVTSHSIVIIQGNGKPDSSVVTRTTYHLNDG
jgi:hypothetical protein